MVLQLSWKETHCFLLVFAHRCVYYVHSHRFYGPSKYNTAHSWSTPKMSSIIFWWGLIYFSQNCGRRPGLCHTVTVHRDTGETFDLTPVNRWRRHQLRLSWQMHPVSAGTSNFRWHLTGVISGLMCLERLETAWALTTLAFNPVCYLDMGKSFAFSHLSWTLGCALFCRCSIQT